MSLFLQRLRYTTRNPPTHVCVDLVPFCRMAFQFASGVLSHPRQPRVFLTESRLPGTWSGILPRRYAWRGTHAASSRGRAVPIFEAFDCSGNWRPSSFTGEVPPRSQEL